MPSRWEVAEEDAYRKTVARLEQRRRVAQILLNIHSAICIIVFVVALYENNWALTALNDNPLVGLNLTGLDRMGATSSLNISKKFQYWRLVSSCFIHAGVIHLWSNLGALWTFGSFLTRAMPVKYIVLLFFVSGFGGVLVSANIATSFVTSAASSPVFGFVGATCMLLLLQRRKYSSPMYSSIVIAVVLGWNLFLGATPFIDNAANVASFFVGSCLGASIILVHDEDEHLHSSSSEHWRQGWAAALAAFSVLICVLGLIGLNTSLPVGGCCDELVCTSSSLWNCSASRVSSSACSFVSFYNGTVQVSCPLGSTVSVNSITNGTSPAALQYYCSIYCGA